MSTLNVYTHDFILWLGEKNSSDHSPGRICTLPMIGQIREFQN